MSDILYGRRERMFLQFLSETGRVRYAWQLAGGDPKNLNSLYHKRRNDTAFAKAWAEAVEIAGDALEDEAFRRAKEGVTKDIYYKGEVVGHEQVYSDGLMSKMLDGAKPEKYAPKKEQTNVQVQIGLAVIPMTAPSLDEWEKQALESRLSNAPLIEVKAREVVPVAGPKEIASKKVVIV